jgi:hypothetical protein
MAERISAAQPDDCAQQAQPSGTAYALDRVQELTWAMLDEQIADDDRAWLDCALCSSAEARSTYLRCVQIHTDLTAYFAAPGKPASAKLVTKSPVLGFLCGGILPLTVESPSSEATS